MNIYESLENLNVSEECFDEIMGIVETLVGKYKEEGKPVTSYSDHHGKNISNNEIKNEMKGELYPKKASKHLDKALSIQRAERETLNRPRDLDDLEPWRKLTKMHQAKNDNKQLADMYMGKAYVTGKVTDKADSEYKRKRAQISEECLNNIMGIVEEILSEKVTVERARKAAEKSIPARQKEYEKHFMTIHDPDFPTKYDPKANERASARLKGAEKMAELPKGDNRDYAKLRKAARKVRSDRKDEVIDATEYSSGHNPEIPRLEDRYEKAKLFATDSNGKLENKK